jgi:acyl-CoA reductase-like NAD-dependent aldehyde dehydrogenase
MTTVKDGPLCFGHYINGQTIDPKYDEEEIVVTGAVPVTSPATNKPVLHFIPSNNEDVDSAIEAAHDAFHARDTDATAWSHPSQSSRRSAVLTSIAALLRQNTERLADLEVRQIGRPRKEMRFQLSRLPEWFDYFASLCRVHEDSVKPFGPGYLNITKRVPLGVIAQIAPFNHPLLITIKKLAPAIAAGNCVVVKPSELAPASIVELAKLCGEAGLPPGVFNVVLGGKEVGERLISHERISKVDFTGGPAVGRSIGAAAGANLCAVTQELGGKAPMIVFGPPGAEDCSATYSKKGLSSYLSPIVNGTAFGAFIASGQTCIAGTRIIIHASVYDAFKEKLVEKTKVFRTGDPEHMETTIGPVISAKHLSFIESCVEEGLQDPSLELLCGGKRYTGFVGEEEHLNQGNYFEPTVIAAKKDMAANPEAVAELHKRNVLFQRELFGPVVLLIPFKSRQEAIDLANDSQFGLGCSIWTNDLAEAHFMADAVHSGIIWLNDHHKNGPASPWGGLKKQSGIGRENGIEAYNEYTQAKNIVFNTNRFSSNWFSDPNARYN